LRVTSGPLRCARNDDGDGNGDNDGADHGETVGGGACRMCRAAEGHEGDGREDDTPRGVNAGVPSRLVGAGRPDRGAEQSSRKG
jgi:hypothetical protein